jgi:biotin carboxyl carrier protein
MAPKQRKQSEKPPAAHAKPQPSPVADAKARQAAASKRAAQARLHVAALKADEEGWVSPVVGHVARATVLIFALVSAYQIRLHAVINFGCVSSIF